jgi:hypothetical protein
MPAFMMMDHESMDCRSFAYYGRPAPEPQAESEPSTPKKPLVQTYANSDSASTAATDDAASAKGAAPQAFPNQEMPVKNTFISLPVEVPEGSRRRNESCPPRIRTPCTVMLRHIPNRAKLPRIEEHLHALGFHGCGVHLPLDARTGVNKGYAFVRLDGEEMAAAFCAAVFQTRLPGASSSSKRLMAVPAANQGAPLRPRHQAYA